MSHKKAHILVEVEMSSHLFFYKLKWAFLWLTSAVPNQQEFMQRVDLGKTLLGIIEIIIDIVNLIAEYWNHYQNCQSNMELWKSLPLSHDGCGNIEMDNFCPPPLFVQAMTSLLLHKSLFFVDF